MMIDLTHTTFMIPFKRDHADREENLRAVRMWIEAHFLTNIVTTYTDSRRLMHRTRMLNDMAREAETPVVVIMDTDCIVDRPQAFKDAETLILAGKADFVRPFNTGNHLADREASRAQGFFDKPDASRLVLQRVAGMPLGGIVFCSRKAYWKAGGENENFIAYGPEDQERAHRWEKLGFRQAHVEGTIWHVEHWRGPDSSVHQFTQSNDAEFEKVKAMTREQLEVYVQSWPWARLGSA